MHLIALVLIFTVAGVDLTGCLAVVSAVEEFNVLKWVLFVVNGTKLLKHNVLKMLSEMVVLVFVLADSRTCLLRPTLLSDFAPH